MANLMDLVRELKSLNARKKAGETLSDDENSRRKELKKYLKTALANQSQTGGAVSATGTPVNPTRSPSSPAPAAGRSPSSPVMPAAGRSPSSPAMPAAGRSPSSPAMPAAGRSPSSPAMPVAGRSPSSPAMPAVGRSPSSPAMPAAEAQNRFAVDAESLFAEASASAAVTAAATGGTRSDSSATNPAITFETASELSDVASVEGLANMNPLDAPEKASKVDLEAAAAKASKAAKANRPKLEATKPEEIENAWEDVHQRNGYTPPEIHLNHEEYFEGYLAEGMTLVKTATAANVLEPIDPREIELHRAGLGEKSVDANAVPRGLVFLDDFVGLYSSGGLSGPADDVEPDIDDPNLLIPGKRKVTVHLLAGGVKRGVVKYYERGALGFTLDPVGAGQSEELAIGQIKAMFVHKGKGRQPVGGGRDVTVTFKDGKSVKGATDDYSPSAPVFSLVPPPGRGQFELIVVNGGAANVA